MSASSARATEGLEVYLVGGAVRDALLGYPFVERDWVVVGATVDEMIARGFRPVGRDFPVFLHPQTHEEYALARTERKSGHGYSGFVVHASPEVTLEQDLERRDLTINAMARSADGSLVDPFGGARDLAARRLRHIGDAFAEDPLRVLRVARFLARYAHLGFHLDDRTGALLASMVAQGELVHLVPERVWKESEKALGERTPSAYFALLERCGALAVWFPELAAAGRLEDALARLDAVVAGGLEAVEDRWAALVLGLDEDEQARLAERLKLPNLPRERARLLSFSVARLAVDSNAEAMLEWCEGIDLWRRPDRLAPLLALIELVAPELPLARLDEAARAAQAVSPRQLVAAGVKGAEIGARLREARGEAIRRSLGG